METIFINSENSKTSEPHRFKLDLTDKLNLKDPKKNMALANLIYQMVLILLWTFKITLTLSSKNTKLSLKI